MFLFNIYFHDDNETLDMGGCSLIRSERYTWLYIIYKILFLKTHKWLYQYVRYSRQFNVHKN